MNKIPSGNYEETIPKIEEHNFNYKYVTRRTYKHKISSRKGNLKKTPHSSHRNAKTKVEVIFPSGVLGNSEIKLIFDNIEITKSFIRKNIPSLKNSALTNISSAMNGTGRFKDRVGCAYGLKFKNIKEKEYEKF